MKNKNAEVRLAGRWRLSRMFTVTATEEKNLKVFQDQEYVADFSSGDTVTESAAGEETTVAYHYDVTTRTISFQQSSRCQPSPISGRVDLCFRVIPLNQSEMYFMSPPAIEDESDEFEIVLLERIE